MILVEDSRQQANKHKEKHAYFLKNGINWTRETLSCGDYQIAGKGDVAVDTKKDIDELINDIHIKTIGKREVENQLIKLFKENNIRKQVQDLYAIITAEDINRDVENEITMYCYQNQIPENLISQIQKLYIKHHGFFHRGLVRAQIRHIDYYILVADDGGYVDKKETIYNKPITCIEDLFSWKNKRAFIFRNGKQVYPNATKGHVLAKALLTIEKKYGCKFVFCKNKDMGKMIIDLLTKENSDG